MNSEETTPVEDAAELPGPLAALSPEKRDAIARAAAQLAQNRQRTISGSEAPTDAKPAENEGETSTGKDVDWSEYDVPFNLRHLYPQATVRMTDHGPKWVVMLDEFRSTERAFKQFDKLVPSPFRDTDGTVIEEHLNLGQYLGNILNGPEGWHLISVMPAGTGAGVLLRRQVPSVLPDPVRIKKETEVAAPRDVELTRINDAALDFAASEGGTSDGEPDAPQGRSLERLALDLNGPPARTPRPLGAYAEIDEDTVARAAATIGADTAQQLANEDAGY